MTLQGIGFLFNDSIHQPSDTTDSLPSPKIAAPQRQVYQTFIVMVTIINTIKTKDVIIIIIMVMTWFGSGKDDGLD